MNNPGVGLERWLHQEMPKPGSSRGYRATVYVTPLVLMLNGGGRSLEDMRTLKNDTALTRLLRIDPLPSTDALGDWLRRTGADAPTFKVIDAIADSAWKQYADCSVDETLHSMNGTKTAFRLIVIKHTRQAELFEDKSRVHVIASNGVESTEATLVWYRQRGEVSENGIKELKIGFGMERIPCGQFDANATFFRIGVIAHNLFMLFKHSTLGADWQRHNVVTVRWRLLHLPGKGVRQAGAWVLKVAADVVALFRDIRAKSVILAQALAP